MMDEKRINEMLENAKIVCDLSPLQIRNLISVSGKDFTYLENRGKQLLELIASEEDLEKIIPEAESFFRNFLTELDLK